ncbi:hypothetical protein OG883_16745 [Streptomyces sp. NBC_01142]|uniref:gamma carbonic anhydrase family protein n=1 Tax=Streptomyces sp. NBC_01142 TaxID=2975865 RepID=UPI00224FBF82|nr:hypothetical protein [Streptomyces sp. NBC_01142]MCX4821513.1 hypothetical protein [Streptomyces sp. NBC_01142]
MAAGCRVLFGAVLTAEGGPVELGEDSIVMENAVLRGTRRDPLILVPQVLVGPTSYLTGCRVEDEVFLATGSRVFNGALIGTRSEVRINGIVHLRTALPADTTVPAASSRWTGVPAPACPAGCDLRATGAQRMGRAVGHRMARIRQRPGERQGRVRMRGPWSVMATVCSMWAALLPSVVRRVQPSISVR